MMSSNVRTISFIILVFVMILRLPVNCEAKAKKSENYNNSERPSKVQIESTALKGIILSAMQTILQPFGLGFIINPVLVGILQVWNRIRPPFQYFLNLLI